MAAPTTHICPRAPPSLRIGRAPRIFGNVCACYPFSGPSNIACLVKRVGRETQKLFLKPGHMVVQTYVVVVALHCYTTRCGDLKTDWRRVAGRDRAASSMAPQGGGEMENCVEARPPRRAAERAANPPPYFPISPEGNL